MLFGYEKPKSIFRYIFNHYFSYWNINLQLNTNFETTEFDQNAIIQISEGSTTTLLEGDSTTTTIVEEINEIIDIEQSEIDKLLQNNNTTNISEYFETYLLIGSDRRSENSSASRGLYKDKEPT